MSGIPENRYLRMPAPGPSGGRRAELLELEALLQRGQDRDQLLDLVVPVRRGDLDPEAHLALRREGVRGHRHVDPVLEEVPANVVDLLVVRERDLDDRVTRGV